MRTVLVLTAGLFLLGQARAQGQAKLEWKWKENETFYVVTQRIVKQKLIIEEPSDAKKNREVTHNYEVGTRLRYRVKSKEMNGNFVLEQVVEQMVIKNPKGTTAAIPGVQEATLTFQINPQGEISEVKGHDALIKKLADQGTERELLKTTFSEQTLKESLQEMFAILPPPGQKQGESWTRKSNYELGSLGKMEVTRTFGVVGEDKKDNRPVTRLTVAAKSAQTFAKDKREVSASGNIYFDAARGRLHSADITRTTRSATKIKIDKEQPCELEQTDTINITVVEKEGE